MSTLLPRRPLLSGLYHVVPAHRDRVLISNAGRSVALTGDDFAERVAPLLAALDGDTPFEELEARFPGLAPDVVAALHAKGLVTDGAESPTTVPAGTATALASRHSVAEVNERLRTARVAIVGCGPVGTTAATLLAKAGVGKLWLSDDAEVSGGQVAATPALAPSAEGRPAAHAAAQAARHAGAAAADVALSPLPAELAGRADLAVAEFGYGAGASSADKLDLLLTAGCPYLIHSQDALEAVIGPFVQPGGRPCHRCLDERGLSHQAHWTDHLAYRAHRADCVARPDAFLAAHAALVAGTMATECLKLLAGDDLATSTAALVLDLAAMTLRREEVLPVPGCPQCGIGSIDAPGGSEGNR